MYTFFLLFLPILAAVGPAVARSRHVITPPPNDIDPSSLAWDPSAQHFLVGSRNRPLISSVSDAGVIQTLTLTLDPSTNSSTSSISSIAIDSRRRRVLAAFSSPHAVSAFDIRSLRPLFTSPLPAPPSSIAVDPSTGRAFIAVSDQILAADLSGEISPLAQVSGADLAGLAHVSRGFLLATERAKGGMVKVDDEDGTARRVLAEARSPEAAVAVRSDGAAAVAGEAAVRWVESRDGWAEARVLEEVKVEEGEKVAGVAVREGRRVYILVKGEGQNGKEWRIEEVEWRREEEGLVWVMMLVGLGLAYFMYWRFQMGKLVTSLNKKRS